MKTKLEKLINLIRVYIKNYRLKKYINNEILIRLKNKNNKEKLIKLADGLFKATKINEKFFIEKQQNVKKLEYVDFCKDIKNVFEKQYKIKFEDETKKIKLDLKIENANKLNKLIEKFNKKNKTNVSSFDRNFNNL